MNIDADLIQKGGIVGKKDESLVALQNLSLIHILNNGLNNDWTVKDRRPLADLSLNMNFSRRWVDSSGRAALKHRLHVLGVELEQDKLDKVYERCV